MEKVCLFKNIKSPDVMDIIDVDEILNYIKDNPFKDKILDGRLTRNTENIKYQVPCVNFNFIYDKTKIDNNIIKSTGFIYIDVDNQIDINRLDLSKVYAYWKSISGRGYGILVRVEGSTRYNFKLFNELICKELFIPYDKAAAKPNQSNALSYDENIYINRQSLVFNFINYNIQLIKKYIPYVERPLNTNKISDVLKYKDIIKTINHNNHKELCGDNQYIYDKEGIINEVKIFLPYNKVKNSLRNMTLFSYGVNLVFLNKDITIETIRYMLNYFNKYYLEEPLEYNEVCKISNNIMEYNKNNTLKPIYSTKLRKIIFNPTYNISTTQKKKIWTSIHNKRNNIEQNIYDTIENWNFKQNPKITYRTLSNIANLSPKTISKYKDLINNIKKNLYNI